MRKNSLLELLKSTMSEFVQDNCMRVSAALSYYAIFALPPLLILIVAICGLFFDTSDIEGRVAAEMATVIGADGAERVKAMIHSADMSEKSTLMSIVGVLALLFGASGVVVQLQGALNDVWEVQPDPEAGGVWNFVTKRILSVAMIVGIGFLLLISLVLTTIASMLSESILPSGMSTTVTQIASFLTGFLMTTLLFATVFKFLPDVKIPWKETWLGAIFTSTLFTIGKFVIGLYFANSSVGSAYGAASSVILLLVWIYYSGIIVMLGAEFTQAWAKIYGTDIEPSKDAVRVVTSTEKVEEDTSKGPFVTV